MTFINDWQNQLNESYAEFTQIADRAEDIDFVYGLVAAAVLWPISSAVKQYNLEAIRAIQQLVGTDKGGPVLNVIQRWPDDRLVAARDLAAEAQTNTALRFALDMLVDYFEAKLAMTARLAKPLEAARQQATSISLRSAAESSPSAISSAAWLLVTW